MHSGACRTDLTAPNEAKELINSVVSALTHGAVLLDGEPGAASTAVAALQDTRFIKSCCPLDQRELNLNPTRATHPAAGQFPKGNKAKTLVPTMSEASPRSAGASRSVPNRRPRSFSRKPPALSSCRRQSHLNTKPFISKMSSLLVVKATFIVSPSLFPPPIKKKKQTQKLLQVKAVHQNCLFSAALVWPSSFFSSCLSFTPPPHTHITHHTSHVQR